MESYTPPLALTIISSISIGIAAIIALWIALDILLRKGWRTMMAIMIPVYVVNASYLWPLTLWTYLNYGRPSKPSSNKSVDSHAAHHPPHGSAGGETSHAHTTEGGHETHGESSDLEKGEQDAGNKTEGPSYHHHDMSSERPMFATITVAVCHCGAGCVLGDIIGEWLVYGTGATISRRSLYPEFLVDFAFAIFFGLIFQYFSIAPMAGAYGPKTLWRAAKADILSLVFFEIGLFGWMAIFQIAIFDWKLEMNTVTYWWMMQIGMFLGHWTACPINWWLIKKGVKEPCA